VHRKKKRREASQKSSKPSERPLKNGPSSERKRSYYTLTIRADDGKKFSMGFKFGKVIVYTGQGKTRQASKSEVKRYYTALAKKEKKQLGD
jgi:curved DNA-binding protein CbpA